MSITFAQPAPSGAFSKIADQGNLPAYLSAYTHLMGAAQDRYASERASAGREMLGYAQLNQDAALRREALGLQANEQANAPMIQQAAIQNRARAEMDQWAAQRAFTQRDQMELNRQQAVVGEIMTKMNSGEISEEEGYQAMGRAAPLINSLQAREQYTRNKALEEQKRAMAADYNSKVEQRDNALAFQRAEMDNKLGTYVPPRYKLQLSEMMADAHPNIPQGTPEWDAMSTMMADEMNWTERFTKNAKGEMVFEKQVKGHGTSGESAGTAGGQTKPMSERDVSGVAKDALHAASAYFKDQGKDPSEEELMTEATKRMNIINKLTGERTGGGEKAQARKVHESAVNGLEETVKQLESTPGAQSHVQKILDLMKKYPPEQRPKAIQKKIDSMTDAYKKFEAFRASQAKPAAAAPSAEQAATQPPQQWGNTFLTDVGNVGRSARQAVAGTVRQAGQGLSTLPEGIVQAAPLPDSWRRYLFGD